MSEQIASIVGDSMERRQLEMWVVTNYISRRRPLLPLHVHQHQHRHDADVDVAAASLSAVRRLLQLLRTWSRLVPKATRKHGAEGNCLRIGRHRSFALVISFKIFFILFHVPICLITITETHPIPFLCCANDRRRHRHRHSGRRRRHHPDATR